MGPIVADVHVCCQKGQIDQLCYLLSNDRYLDSKPTRLKSVSASCFVRIQRWNMLCEVSKCNIKSGASLSSLKELWLPTWPAAIEAMEIKLIHLSPDTNCWRPKLRSHPLRWPLDVSVACSKNWYGFQAASRATPDTYVILYSLNMEKWYLSPILHLPPFWCKFAFIHLLSPVLAIQSLMLPHEKYHSLVANHLIFYTHPYRYCFINECSSSSVAW